jgi:phytoene dehydrogenase-like protein
MSDYDAIVVGAGHNGLSAATMLAKEGLKVLTLEKNSYVGGMATTRELFKGFKHNVGAWLLLVFRDEMLKLLELEEYGLEQIRPRTAHCSFGAPEDTPFVAYTDQMQMAEHLMKDHGPGVLESFMGLADYLQKFKALLDSEYHKAPAPLERLIAEAPDEKTRAILIKTVHGSAIDVIRQFFPDPDRHRCIVGSLCTSAIDGVHMGPYTPGSGFSLAWHYTMGEYDFRTTKGGIGALSETLRKSVEDRGGEIRCNTQVKRFLIEGGRVVGVQSKSGEKISAKVVLSSLDALTTFAGLAGEEHLPSDFAHALKEIEYRNGYLQLHLTLKELPEFTGHLAFANENKVSALMAYIPSADHLSRCWEQYRRGDVPDEPATYCTIPSLLDPSLAPEGNYTCTIYSQYFPCDLPEGKHKVYSELMADRMIDQIAKYAPNFRSAIMDKAVMTYKYFENVFGITRGDFCQGMLHPGQMWDKRPVPGWSNYRTPLQNLYMCGSACHPGPGVTCVPGYNSAREVLRDLGK